MRSLSASLAVFGLVAWAGHSLLGQTPPGLAQPSPSPTTMAIMSSQADVYSGPSTSFYPTSRLRYGDRVVILGESKKQPGWLEILPPPGSFSWIDARHIKMIPGIDKVGIVDAGDPKGTVPVLPGSAVVNKEPNVEITRIATGTQVLILDRVTPGTGVSWIPIAPVAHEVRFIPMDAVRPGGGQTTTASNPWNTPTVPTGGFQPQQPVDPNAFVEMARQGDQALASGNVERARLLYIGALGQTNDAAWRNYLQNQLAKVTPASTWNPGGQPNTPNMAGTYQTASTVRPASDLTPAPNTGIPSGPPPATGQKQWSPWGVLRTTSVTSREGQPMYVLENRTTREPLLYITNQPSTSLRDHVNQTVALYGAMAYRNDDYVRMQYLIAEQVATPPAGAK